MPVSGAGGKLIRFGERLNGDAFTQYQHAEVYIGTSLPATIPVLPGKPLPLVPVASKYGWTLSAYPGGARLMPLDCPPEELPGALWSSDAFGLTPQQRSGIVAASFSVLGTPYSFIDYAALSAHRLHIPAPGLQSFIADTGHLICSQLCDEVHYRAGVHLFDDWRWPGYVTPADLATLIMSTL